MSRFEIGDEVVYYGKRMRVEACVRHLGEYHYDLIDRAQKHSAHLVPESWLTEPKQKEPPAVNIQDTIMRACKLATALGYTPSGVRIEVDRDHQTYTVKPARKNRDREKTWLSDDGAMSFISCWVIQLVAEPPRNTSTDLHASYATKAFNAPTIEQGLAWLIEHLEGMVESRRADLAREANALQMVLSPPKKQRPPPEGEGLVTHQEPPTDPGAA